MTARPKLCLQDKTVSAGQTHSSPRHVYSVAWPTFTIYFPWLFDTSIFLQRKPVQPTEFWIKPSCWNQIQFTWKKSLQIGDPTKGMIKKSLGANTRMLNAVSMAACACQAGQGRAGLHHDPCCHPCQIDTSTLARQTFALDLTGHGKHLLPAKSHMLTPALCMAILQPCAGLYRIHINCSYFRTTHAK